MTVSAKLEDRLVKGAAVLGRFWREGKRCARDWSDGCSCEVPSEFCKAKAKWLELLMARIEEQRAAGDELRAIPLDSKFGLVECMTSAELSASGLTVELEGEVGRFKVGPKGDIEWKDFCKSDGKVLSTVLKVLRSFPGAKLISEEVSK